jgi:hypothetical protein
MNRVPDKDVDDTTQPAREPAGRVEFDSRGNSVWRWAKDVLESTSVLLKRLENKDLALEPTQKVPVMRAPDKPQKGAKPQAGAKPPANAQSKTTAPSTKPAARHPALAPDRRRGGGGGGGFDPYNSR